MKQETEKFLSPVIADRHKNTSENASGVLDIAFFPVFLFETLGSDVQSVLINL